MRNSPPACRISATCRSRNFATNILTLRNSKYRCLDMFDAPTKTTSRQSWLGILARASLAHLSSLLESTPALPEFQHLRVPESGMAMVRGRMGGGGAAFNLGEMTLARCSIRDAAGRIGHGYASGRDTDKVELIARLDAV